MCTPVNDTKTDHPSSRERRSPPELFTHCLTLAPRIGLSATTVISPAMRRAGSVAVRARTSASIRANSIGPRTEFGLLHEALLQSFNFVLTCFTLPGGREHPLRHFPRSTPETVSTVSYQQYSACYIARSATLQRRCSLRRICRGSSKLLDSPVDSIALSHVEGWVWLQPLGGQKSLCSVR